MVKLTQSQYKIIADRMIEEHRKYGDALRTGHWAEIAARKVVSHLEDFERNGERMFTESEVKSMLDLMAMEVGNRPSDSYIDIRGIAQRCLGIVLDPASLALEQQKTFRAIELAKQCAEKTRNGSAIICLGDAYRSLGGCDKPPFGRTNESQAMRHALRSLMHSVGILSPIYAEVRDSIRVLPDFDPELDSFP